MTSGLNNIRRHIRRRWISLANYYHIFIAKLKHASIQKYQQNTNHKKYVSRKKYTIYLFNHGVQYIEYTFATILPPNRNLENIHVQFYNSNSLPSAQFPPNRLADNIYWKVIFDRTILLTHYSHLTFRSEFFLWRIWKF